MKRATIRARRRLADGRRLINVVCPICGGRHWLPDTDPIAACPRRPGEFTIPTERKSK